MKALFRTVLIVCTLPATVAHAQSIAPELISGYNPSIVSKVYEINKQTPLSNQQQAALARLLQERDSTVTQMILQQQPDSVILARKNGFEQKIYALAEVKQYNDTLIARKARALASADLASLSQYHRTGPLTATGLGDLLFARYQLIIADMIQRPITAQATLQAVSQLNAVIHNKTDSVISAAYAYNYLRQLDAIKKLPDTVKGKIAERFARLGRGRELTRAERMEAALRSFVADTAIYARLYKNEIQRQARLLTQAEVRQYAKYKPSKECHDELIRLADQKNYELALTSETYSQWPAKRDSIFYQTCHLYDSLIERSLYKDGALINASYFSAAVRMRKLLKLTNTQVDSLLDKGLTLNRLRDSVWRISPLAPFDSKDYENQHISRILTEDQLALLLTFKYQHDAETNALNDWKDLEKRGLTRDMNKEVVVRQLTSYYIQLKSTSSMYAYDLEKQTAYSRNIRDNMPKALKILQYARKNNVTSASAQNLKIEW
ncbi:hypothetical protein HB364_29550 [Pseudoflavitalea sp. X16]|uniref:hypothetical protein n=1 Tax=Paraflavitalea devenefica TaxID=2716334 RepID=UPI0014232A3F|nr:hypothetical protein [Paraflavitalea devenefica]NII29261.1 hypothetical protein [Paraflavitalea devenefica]